MDTKPEGRPLAPRMTRDQVARRLGVCITTVRRLERAGKLRPTRNQRGVWVFDPSEVERVAAARTLGSPAGALASRVFQALRDGMNLRDIVIAFQLSPAMVRALYAEWEALGPTERGVDSERAGGRSEC